jgi:hypothetical protein
MEKFKKKFKKSSKKVQKKDQKKVRKIIIKNYKLLEGRVGQPFTRTHISCFTDVSNILVRNKILSGSRGRCYPHGCVILKQNFRRISFLAITHVL